MVDSNQIRADVTYLADDKLLGRAPGTPGYQMAVDYVVGRLKGLNVKPAGENRHLGALNRKIQEIIFKRWLNGYGWRDQQS